MRHAEDPRPQMLIADVRHVRVQPSYLHHLFKAEEVLSLMLLSWHNIQYYQDLMAAMRVAIGRHIGRIQLIPRSKPAVIKINWTA